MAVHEGINAASKAEYQYIQIEGNNLIAIHTVQGLIQLHGIQLHGRTNP